MDKITIFTAADVNYELQVRVFIESIRRSQSQQVHLIVLGNGWTASKLRGLESLENDLISIEVISVDISAIDEIQLTNGFPYATAYNVIAPRFILNKYNRLLYMDADIIVVNDLSDLWKSDLAHPVGAVIDSHIAWIGSPSMWRPWKEEGIDPSLPYLNTGVMLIDVARWNAEMITEESFSFLKKYKLPCVDQDALNMALAGQFDIIKPKFNMMPYHLLTKFRYIDINTDQSQIVDAICNPVAIHFHRSFLGKPWLWGCRHPSAKIWQEIADDVSPGWRKKIGFREFLRNWVAKKIGLLEVDLRVTEHSN
jgi:lipopolysaccharide biosynthesis glycosyltransferase